jgi:hypothetical protein
MKNAEGRPRQEAAPTNTTTEANPNPLLESRRKDWALLYGRNGWPVFPGEPGGKRPLSRLAPHWKDDATTYAGIIKGWFDEAPDANVAIATGARSGIIVVDIDAKSGGYESLAALEGHHGPLPRTAVVNTGGGGHHIYLKHPGGKVKNLVGKVAPGIDLKADNGYVIAPPSAHSSGGMYSWVGEMFRLQEAPSWFLELIKDKPREPAGPVPEIIGDYRNNTLTSLAGSMRRRGLTVEEMLPSLRAVNEGRCSPPLDDSEVVDIAGSVARYAPEAVPNLSPPPPQPQILWPEMRDEAFHGLFAEIVDAIAPHTEADRPALLITALSMFGCAAGAHWHAQADGADHPARIDHVLVGETSRGRKGTAWANMRRIFNEADPFFIENQVTHGLASGEGLVAAVKDPSALDDEDRPPPVQDKRLLVIESEFARTLKVAAKEGSTLSTIIRQAWDSGDLRVMTKNSPHRASGAHIVVMAHITRAELRKYLSATEVASGFANRFLFCLTRRSKKLPEGGGLAPETIEELGKKIKKTLDLIKLQRDPPPMVRAQIEAKKLWAHIYFNIPDADGLYGSVTARVEAQMLRLQVLYALADGWSSIGEDHVKAASSVWDFCDTSAALIFNDRADPRVERFVEAVRAAGDKGLDGVAQHKIFDGHLSKDELEEVRSNAERAGLVETTTEPTAGRPKIVTRARVRIKPESANKGTWGANPRRASDPLFAKQGFIRTDTEPISGDEWGDDEDEDDFTPAPYDEELDELDAAFVEKMADGSSL